MMARRSSILTLLALCLSACYPVVVQGRGLLGERYVDVLIGVTKPGDDVLEELDNSIMLFGAELNWPLRRDVDLNVSASHEEIDGTLSDAFGVARLQAQFTSVLVGANFQFRPEEKVNPFLIGRFGLVHTQIEEREGALGTDIQTETDAGVVLGAGVEFDLNKDAAVTPSLTYQRAGDADDVILGADVNVWFTDALFALGGLAIGFEEADLTFFIGAGLGF